MSFYNIIVLVLLSSSIQEAGSFQVKSFAKKCLDHATKNVDNNLILRARADSDSHKINTHNDFDENDMNFVCNNGETSRRSLLSSASILGLALLSKPLPSHAGLVQFPCNYDLMNTYHLMRAGESLLESEDILATNPLFMTNRDNALSRTGIEQVEAACIDMMENDVNPSVVKYSLAAKSIDTANIIASQMQVGRNRLIPEYTFMDPRGVGLWDMQHISDVEEAIWALDHDEAGLYGEGGRTPPTDDSTPNETLFNQAIRLRQLMSILETQFSGDTILLVFPDGTSPALLMCLIAGIPVNRVHEFNFKPGQVMYNVTMDTVLKTAMSDEQKMEYLAAIERGREKLKNAIDDPNQFIEEIKADDTVYYQEMTKTKAHERRINSSNISTSQYFALLGIPFLAMISKVLNPSSETEDYEEQADDIDESKHGSDRSRVVENGIDQAPELKKMEELIVKAPFDIPEMNQKDIKKERIEKANLAMEEYLNQDDGGEGWIGFMSDLLHEEN